MNNELIEKNGIEKFAFVTDGYAAKFIKLLVDLRDLLSLILTPIFFKALGLARIFRQRMHAQEHQTKVVF